MPYPILPQIDNNRCQIAFTSSGVWDEHNDSKFLDKLVNSLDQGNSLANVRSIDSIPHVWAKPLLFKMALFDSDNQFVQGLKDHVNGEWRSLLAMLALKNMMHLSLTVTQINLNTDTSAEAGVFSRLAPKDSLDGNATTWVTHTYIINFDGAPIAMTSPLTLVATAADYAANLKAPLTQPWSNDGSSLSDPTPHLGNTELNALSFWLDDLRQNLTALAALKGANINLINNLLGCLNSYINDVNARITIQNTATLQIAPSPLNLSPLLNGLLQNTVISTVPITTSNVKLVLDSQRTNRQLLLISPQMLQELEHQSGIPLAQIAIWGGLTANRITENTLHYGHAQIGNLPLINIEFRRPEEFFQDKIILIHGADVFPTALDFAGKAVLNNSRLTAVLPIKPELAEIFSPKEIGKRISISYNDNNGTATLSFEFTLSGTNGNPTRYFFRKSYSQSNNTLIVANTTIPVLEIWPNFRSDLWQNYYLHYSNPRSESDNPNQPPKNLCFFKPWSLNKDFRAFLPQNALADIFTAKLDCFPDALICTYVTKDAVPIEAGMVFLKKPKYIPSEPFSNWKIGVDFGTSATMLFFAKNGQEPQPLNIKPHLLKITNSDDASRNRNSLNFISPDENIIHDGSFLSVFHLLNHQVKNNIRPLQDGHVLLLTSKSPYLGQPQYANYIDTNLKWTNTLHKIDAYISQICMQAFVEALSNGVSAVEWHFSYPIAFTATQKRNFKIICNDAVKNATNNPAVEGNFHSESEASAYYFFNLNGQTLDNAICIDIGAGTTDISVISDSGRIIFHTSIQYAGRSLFHPIYENFKVFGLAGVEGNNITDDKAQAAIDLDMRDNSDNYINNLGRIVTDSNIPARRALQLSQLAVAGLFYYLGKVLKALHDTNCYTSDTLPQVFIGGNGSRIFHWLTLGDNTSDNIANDPFLSVFGDILSATTDLQSGKYGGFTLQLSQRPKVEVAGGMLSPTPANVAASQFYNQNDIDTKLSAAFPGQYSPNAVIAGAHFSTKNNSHKAEAHKAEDFLTAQQINNGVEIDNLDELEKFIKTFNNSEGLILNGIATTNNQNYNNTLAKVLRGTTGFYSNQINKPTNEIAVEPVFIVELRELIKNSARL